MSGYKHPSIGLKQGDQEWPSSNAQVASRTGKGVGEQLVSSSNLTTKETQDAPSTLTSVVSLRSQED